MQLVTLGHHFDLTSFEQRLCQSTMKQCTRFGGKSVAEFTLLRLEEARVPRIVPPDKFGRFYGR